MHPLATLIRRPMLVGAIVLGTGLGGVPGAATQPTAATSRAGVAAIIDWNAVATEAIATEAALPPPLTFVGLGYVQAAVYNAVVGIRGKYAQYRWHASGPPDASVPAAVASAAHRMLLSYFPVALPRVQAAYVSSLTGIRDGAAKTAGIRFGEQAAAHIISLRADDGWLASVPFPIPKAPGVWRPTPPEFAPFTSAFVGRMRPFLLRSHAQLRPVGPPALTSRRYAADVNEVKRLGSADSTARTAAQTDIALFFGGTNYGVQLQSAFRDYLTRHRLDVVRTARYLAAADLAAGDAVITAWDAKLHFGFWRPISAIRLAGTDGNPATAPDPGWTPLVSTPPHSDLLSGHTMVIGAVTRVLTGLLGTQHIDLTLPSVTGETRHYALADQLNADSVGARIWAGIHFRTADEVGNRVGKQVGAWAVTHYFERR